MLIQDCLDICDPVLTFDRFMGEIELEKYLKNIPQHYTGRLRYDPVSMLKTVLFAAMATKERSFYYCDESFSNIQSDIEKRIFGIMLERIGDDEQLIFTTHNTDMLDLNLPKHSYVFLRKHLEEGVYQVSAVSASDVLKRNTDSLRCAVENDVFASLPEDSLLGELEMGY